MGGKTDVWQGTLALMVVRGVRLARLAGGDDMPVALVLDDEDIRSQLCARDAVRWMGEAIDAHHRGDLVAPARVHADLGDGRLVFTTGRLRGSWFDYRSYDTFPAGPGSQVVVVHDEASGTARAIAVGKPNWVSRWPWSPMPSIGTPCASICCTQA